MKNILDDINRIKEIDKQNVLGSVEALPDQCLDAFEEASKIDIPEDYKNIKNVIVTGMGGSGLGARVIESVYADMLKIPFIRVNDYDLPTFTDINSFVLCSSYSGMTEETVENARQSIEKDAKWIAMGTGNELENLAVEHKRPFYKIVPKFNPSNQPRMTVGYQVVGQLVIISKLGLFNLNKSDLDEAVSAMREIQKVSNPTIEYKNNEAKILASKLKDRIVFYISARHMIGSAHTISNQLNENTKNISFDFVIPELNHHLMEGLIHPGDNSKNIFCIMLNSNLYPKRIQERFVITKDVIGKNNIDIYIYSPKSRSKLAQAFEFIQFGGYVNLYLSVLYGQNPAPIPWVDYFKEKLGQPLGK